ncbi:hypothetical protein BYT27DRAFT_7253465 [Phlegmacium glaucopus]|nr:hypothetical protein BYT27DRAFT_7253465 [Phlegmacium glaucopus]
MARPQQLSMYEDEELKSGYQLLCSDGCQKITNTLSLNETISPAAKSILDLLQIPRFIKMLRLFE